MNKAVEILSSWGIMFNPNNNQAHLAEKRILVCDICKHKKINAYVSCDLCGCALSAKIYSPIKGACPAGNWDKIDKE